MRCSSVSRRMARVLCGICLVSYSNFHSMDEYRHIV